MDKGILNKSIFFEFNKINFTLYPNSKKNSHTIHETDESILSLNNTNHTKILNDISGFALPCEVLAIIGPAGCGKTSLLSVLSDRLESNLKFSQMSRSVKNNLLR